MVYKLYTYYRILLYFLLFNTRVYFCMVLSGLTTWFSNITSATTEAYFFIALLMQKVFQKIRHQVLYQFYLETSYQKVVLLWPKSHISKIAKNHKVFSKPFFSYKSSKDGRAETQNRIIGTAQKDRCSMPSLLLMIDRSSWKYGTVVNFV
jgi:hypothetical protein